MRRVLLIANQTLGGQRLAEVVAERIDAGRSSFLVMVPLVQPEPAVSTQLSREATFIAGSAADYVEAVQEARRHSVARMQAMVARIEDLGGTAEGMVGDVDAFRLARIAVANEDFAEVIVSTLPRDRSRWIRMDLPTRLRRHVDCRVTVVVAAV